MLRLVGYRARSGTSALVGACLAGGVPVEYDQETERRFRSGKLAGANPKGFYELSPVAWWRDEGRVAELSERGMLAKAIGPLAGLPFVAGVTYSVVIMERPTVEIDRSSVKAFGKHQRNRPIELVRTALRRRADVVDVVSVSYPELVRRPVEVLGSLPWEVPDPVAGGEFIDPSLHRFRDGGAGSG